MYFSNICYRTSLLEATLSGGSVDPTSQVRASAMFFFFPTIEIIRYDFGVALSSITFLRNFIQSFQAVLQLKDAGIQRETHGLSDRRGHGHPNNRSFRAHHAVAGAQF